MARRRCWCARPRRPRRTATRCWPASWPTRARRWSPSGSPSRRWGPGEALREDGQKSGDWDLYEINEAFSGVTMAAAEEHAIDPSDHQRERRRRVAGPPDRLLGCARSGDAALRAEGPRKVARASRPCASAAARPWRWAWSWRLMATKHTIGIIGTGTMGCGIAQVGGPGGLRRGLPEPAPGVGGPRPGPDREAPSSDSCRRARSPGPRRTARWSASAASCPWRSSRAASA